MKKKSLLAILLLGIHNSYAQVGINTDLPQSTLDVVGFPNDATKFDGIIAPRISAAFLKLKNYTSSQTGALLYITSPDSSPSGQTIDVTSTGYYYFNGDSSVNKWVKLSIEPWRVQGTSNTSQSNTDHIYQQGRVAIGTNSSTVVSSKQLDVAGDFKSQYNNAGNYFGMETNYSYFGIPINAMYISDQAEFSSSTNFSSFFLRPSYANMQVNNSSGNSSIGAFSDSSGSSFSLLASNSTLNTQFSIIGGNSTNNLGLSANKTGEGSSTIKVNNLTGIAYSFTNNLGSPQGEYVFPRNNGSSNQILATDGGSATAALSWKTISQIQSTNSFSVPYETPNSGNLLLNETHYTLRIYGGNTGITLPDASTCKGRVYILIGSNGITSKSINTVSGGGIYDDVTNTNISSISGGQRYQIQSDGVGWIVIGR